MSRKVYRGHSGDYPVTMPVEGMTPNGIEYNTELASIDGVAVYLFKRASQTLEQLAIAKRWLRSQRDVVGFVVVRVEGEVVV